MVIGNRQVMRRGYLLISRSCMLLQQLIPRTINAVVFSTFTLPNNMFPRIACICASLCRGDGQADDCKNTFCLSTRHGTGSQPVSLEISPKPAATRAAAQKNAPPYTSTGCAKGSYQWSTPSTARSRLVTSPLHRRPAPPLAQGQRQGDSPLASISHRRLWNRPLPCSF